MFPEDDDIIGRIHAHRAELSERFGGDLRVIVAHMKRAAAASGMKYVTIVDGREVPVTFEDVEDEANPSPPRGSDVPEGASAKAR